MSSIRIQIISLNKESEAVKSLINSIIDQGLSIEIFDAVDGRSEFPKLEENETLDQTQSLKKRFITLTTTEVACYLSHLRAIRQAMDEGIEKLCLLEDDVYIEENFASVLNELFDLPDQFEFVRLMGLKRHRYKITAKLKDGTNLTCPVKGLCGTQGYVINREGMKKVLSFGSNIAEPIDKFYDHFWDSGLKCYSIVPHIIWERPTTSTIAKQSRRKATRGLKLRILNQWVKITRSIRRNLYILRNRKDFRPSQKPAQYLGRTARIH